MNKTKNKDYKGKPKHVLLCTDLNINIYTEVCIYEHKRTTRNCEQGYKRDSTTVTKSNHNGEKSMPFVCIFFKLQKQVLYPNMFFFKDFMNSL